MRRVSVSVGRSAIPPAPADETASQEEAEDDPRQHEEPPPAAILLRGRASYSITSTVATGAARVRVRPSCETVVPLARFSVTLSADGRRARSRSSNGLECRAPVADGCLRERGR